MRISSRSFGDEAHRHHLSLRRGRYRIAGHSGAALASIERRFIRAGQGFTGCVTIADPVSDRWRTRIMLVNEHYRHARVCPPQPRP
jgi:hypothetical protein